MQLLKTKDHKILLPFLDEVGINTLFARTVLTGDMPGKVYVNDPRKPTTFHIVHPYGMSLLLGDQDNQDFNEQFLDYALNTTGQRTEHEWMQTWPGEWQEKLERLLGDRLQPVDPVGPGSEQGAVQLHTRINFQFDPLKYKWIDPTDPHIRIVRTNRRIFCDMKGSVVPKFFWKSEDHFLKAGTGFSVFYKEQLACTAFSSYIHGNQLELGIETLPEFRGKGLARFACAALIDHCIENHLEPVWSCRLENRPSYQLALSLGFHPTAKIPYYRLSK